MINLGVAYIRLRGTHVTGRGYVAGILENGVILNGASKRGWNLTETLELACRHLGHHGVNGMAVVVSPDGLRYGSVEIASPGDYGNIEWRLIGANKNGRSCCTPGPAGNHATEVAT